MTAFLKDAFHTVANTAQKGCWLVEELPLPPLCPGWIPPEVFGLLGQPTSGPVPQHGTWAIVLRGGQCPMGLTTKPTCSRG